MADELAQIRAKITQLHNKAIARLVDEKTVVSAKKLAKAMASKIDELYKAGTVSEADETKNQAYSQKIAEIYEIVEKFTQPPNRQRKLIFSGRPSEWSGFLSKFSMSTLLLEPDEKLEELRNALPRSFSYLFRGQTSKEDFDFVVKHLSEKFESAGSTYDQLLAEVYSWRMPKELEKITEQFMLWEQRAITAELSEREIDILLRQKLLHAIPLFTLRELKDNADSERFEDLLSALKDIYKRELQVKNTKGRDRSTPTKSQQATSWTNCGLCNGTHASFRCRVGNPTSRMKKAREKNLCTRCLRPNHQVGMCRSKFTCRKCKASNHSTNLCEKNIHNIDFEALSDEDDGPLDLNNLINSKN